MDDSIQIEIVKRHPLALGKRLLPFVDSTVHRLKQVGEFQAGQPLVFITESALQTMESHTKSRTRGELGGLLLGEFCLHGDVPFTCVEIASPAQKAVSRPGSLLFPPEAIDDLDKHREVEYPHLRSVGWYHSHPGFGVFLSSTDLHTPHTGFKDGPFVAVVLDPVRKETGVFSWIGKKVAGPLAYWVVRDME